MRFASALFAILFTAQVLYPCGDATTCRDEMAQGVDISVSDHDHSEREEDSCSPFCICRCCSIKMNQPGGFRFDVPALANSILNYPSPNFTIPVLQDKIWQPPKTG